MGFRVLWGDLPHSFSLLITAHPLRLTPYNCPPTLALIHPSRTYILPPPPYPHPPLPRRCCYCHTLTPTLSHTNRTCFHSSLRLPHIRHPHLHSFIQSSLPLAPPRSGLTGRSARSCSCPARCTTWPWPPPSCVGTRVPHTRAWWTLAGGTRPRCNTSATSGGWEGRWERGGGV